MTVGVVKGSELKKNRDGSRLVLMLQVEISDPDDLQSVELVTGAGEDYHPPVGSRVVIDEAGEAFKIAIAVDDLIQPSAPSGERKIYSISAGAIAALIWLKADGQIEVNGGGGTAVEFARLKIAFDQLKVDFDALVSSYNSHVHITTAVTGGGGPAGVIAPTAATGSPTTANIDPAESDTLEIP